VPEHELAEMAAGGLDYSIRKKLDNQYLRDMAQLTDRVRQIERLKAERARTNRFPKKEKIAYVDTYNSDPEFNWGSDTVEDNEINLAELTDGPPYACKSLRPSNGKNPEEPKNDKYPPKTYTFDVSKCEEIFDLRVADGLILVPKNLKLPPLEQQKKRVFCKFQGFLGHYLSRCTRFRDSVQKTLDEGRLKFGDKSKQPMQVDADPLKKADSIYAEIADINMVEIFDKIVAEMSIPKEKLPTDAKMVTEDQFAEKMKVAYPRAEEDLIDFLKRCKISNTKAILCPRCNAVFDKEDAKSVEGFRPQSKRKSKWVDNRPKFGFNKRDIPYKMKTTTGNSNGNKMRTFNPAAKSPTHTWVFSGGKRSGYSTPPTKWVKRIATTPNQNEASNSKKYAYNNNYKVKYPMSKTQWRRFQRQKKADALKDVT